MSEEFARAAEAISHAAKMAGETWQQAAYDYTRPSVVFKPRLSRDGNKWCALFGDNLQEGVAAFGDSPSEAMYAFDKAWTEKL